MSTSKYEPIENLGKTFLELVKAGHTVEAVCECLRIDDYQLRSYRMSNNGFDAALELVDLRWQKIREHEVKVTVYEETIKAIDRATKAGCKIVQESTEELILSARKLNNGIDSIPLEDYKKWLESLIDNIKIDLPELIVRAKN